RHSYVQARVLRVSHAADDFVGRLRIARLGDCADGAADWLDPAQRLAHKALVHQQDTPRFRIVGVQKITSRSNGNLQRVEIAWADISKSSGILSVAAFSGKPEEMKPGATLDGQTRRGRSRTDAGHRADFSGQSLLKRDVLLEGAIVRSRIREPDCDGAVPLEVGVHGCQVAKTSNEQQRRDDQPERNRDLS